MLNIERIFQKKTLFDRLVKAKNEYQFKNMDIKQGELSSQVFHDVETVRRFDSFNVKVMSIFQQYSKDIQDTYRQILSQKDKINRNPLHYGAMSKFTQCYKTLDALLSIDIEDVPGTNFFIENFFKVQELENNEESNFDPRKYKDVLNEFRHLLSPKNFGQVAQEFKHQTQLLLREALKETDINDHKPLHISSYFGDFKASRLFISKGAKPNVTGETAEKLKKQGKQTPLTVGKDKFSRGVLQDLNGAASTSNVIDLEYLVNCGENIDERASIVGQAPIHKAVLSTMHKPLKEKTLASIKKQNADINIIDSNGWTALHHAANSGDLTSVNKLIEYKANVNAFSNQFKTPLHFAALNNHDKVVDSLLKGNANMEAKDESQCTPLHLACKKGSLACIELLLKKGADIMAQDNRLWTPLHYASYNGHPKAVNFLLVWEADFDKLAGVKNSQGKTAFIISKNEKVKKAFNRKSSIFS